ncbi:hypothetical protein AMAG_04538 [Allomyces macrogynus ATCC 38327]|uniref:Uncharacterized protein n=1 Tax=Allomyces macrogynus (strain ATCC 38327) TaxID=578462 RepID=A0A0L0S561_ALLM3|nr:hypothetical protein AMAG_04538 [Allomyces macrogynus ATCC 38327]|eukprot:KNE57678.1 hypothetical protein AMAG_04538 [Allomyces macrogynus ATCC 38327]
MLPPVGAPSPPATGTGATVPLLKPEAKPPPWPTRAAARLRAIRTAIVTRIPWFWLLKLVISLVLALAVFGAAYKVLALPASAAQGMGAAAGVLCLVTLVVHEWRAHRDHDAAEAQKRLLEDAQKARAHDAESARTGAIPNNPAAAPATTPSMPAPAQNGSFGGTDTPNGTIDRSASDGHSAYNTSTRSGGGPGPFPPADSAAVPTHRMSLTVHLSPNNTAARIRPPSTPSLGSVADASADADGTGGGRRHATSSSLASSSMEASAAALASSAGTSQAYSRSPSSVADSGGAGSDGTGVGGSGIQITAPESVPGPDGKPRASASIIEITNTDDSAEARTYSSLNSSRQRLGPNSSGFPSLLSVGNNTSAAGSTFSMRPSPGSSFSLLVPPGSPNTQSMAHLLAPRHSISGPATAASPATSTTTAAPGPPSIHIPTPNHSLPRKTDASPATTLAVPVDGAGSPSTASSSSPSSPTSTGPRSSPSGTISKGPLVSSLTASTSVLVSINGLNGSSASLAPPSAAPATGPPPARKYSLTSIAPGLLGLRLPTFLSPIPSSGASVETIRTPSAVGSPMSGSAHGSHHSVNHPGGSRSGGGRGAGGAGGSGNDGLLSAAGTAGRRRASFSGAISSLSSPDAAAMGAAVARVAGSTESAAGAGDAGAGAAGANAKIRIIPPELHISETAAAVAPPVQMPATPIPLSAASSLKRHGSSIEIGGTGDRNKSSGPGPRSAALVLGPHAKNATATATDSKLQMARFAFEVREKLKQVLRGPDGGTVAGGPDSLDGSSRASLESTSLGSAAMVAAAAARVPLVVPEREDDEVGGGGVQRVPSPYPQHRAVPVGTRSASPSMPSLARRGVTSTGSSSGAGGAHAGASGSVTAAMGVSGAESPAVSGDVTTAAASELVAASSAGAWQVGTLSKTAGVGTAGAETGETRPAPLAAGRARRPSMVSIVVVDTDAAAGATSLARTARPDCGNSDEG